jgi:hypothetical protein
MRQQSVIMGPEWHGPKCDCSANYRPVLSPERASHFRIKNCSDQEMAPTQIQPEFNFLFYNFFIIKILGNPELYHNYN